MTSIAKVPASYLQICFLELFLDVVTMSFQWDKDSTQYDWAIRCQTDNNPNPHKLLHNYICIYKTHMHLRYIVVISQMYCGHQSDTLWSSVRCIVVISQIHCGHQSDVLWSSVRYIVVISQIHCGHQSDALWSSVRYIVVISQMHCGHQSDTLWSSVNVVLWKTLDLFSLMLQPIYCHKPS